jgi:hypothetical protein
MMKGVDKKSHTMLRAKENVIDAGNRYKRSNSKGAKETVKGPATLGERLSQV